MFSIGCASVGVTTMTTAPPRIKNCNLDIYTNVAEVKKDYEVLCLIDSRTSSRAFVAHSMAAAIKQARPAACKCGADAILIESGTTKGVTIAGWGEGTAILKAIRYK
jgi:hypothetical protein